MTDLGTWAWTEKTGGRLRRRDRLTLMAQAILAQASARLGNARLANGRIGGRNIDKIRHIEVQHILPPDSAICLAAEAISRQASEPFLFNHCMRAYFWARLLNDNPKFDDEALYVALLLHDLGLTDHYGLRSGDCFTLPAARVANSLALSHNWPAHRARIIADAICLHLNVTVAHRHGQEAQLVRIGSGADVAGLRLHQLFADQRNDVINRFPRVNMKYEIDKVLQKETDHCPDCRIAFAYRKLRFDNRIRQTSIFAD